MTIALPELDSPPSIWVWPEDGDTALDLERSHGGGPDEPDGFSHYVKKRAIGDAVVYGTPVEALCGRKWVPTRDPKRYPVCVDCKRIYDQIPEPPAE